VNGRFTPGQRAVVDTVARIQAAMIAEVQVGTTLNALYDSTCRKTEAALKELGLPHRAVKRFFPHSVYVPMWQFFFWNFLRSDMMQWSLARDGRSRYTICTKEYATGTWNGHHDRAWSVHWR
jgi:Xaa-Pro aminopeptidase